MARRDAARREPAKARGERMQRRGLTVEEAPFSPYAFGLS